MTLRYQNLMFLIWVLLKTFKVLPLLHSGFLLKDELQKFSDCSVWGVDKVVIFPLLRSAYLTECRRTDNYVV